MILGNAGVDVLKVQLEGATDGESRMLLKTISRTRGAYGWEPRWELRG
jgi:hypothetical protein